MSNDWWAKKLATPGPQRSSSPPTMPPSRIPYNPYPTTNNPQIAYDPAQDQTTVNKAQSSKQQSRCPECNSGNYFAPPGTQRMRCYDCGYPVIQSGSGVGIPTDSSGPATPARQVSGSGFNPNVIVDRIG